MNVMTRYMTMCNVAIFTKALGGLGILYCDGAVNRSIEAPGSALF